MFFLELSSFFDDPTDVGNLISGPLPLLNSVHILLKTGLENFEHYFASMWDECNCAVVSAFFGIENKAEIDVFLERSHFFCDPVDVGNLISGSSAFSKTSLNIWKYTVHVLLKPGLENFEHYFTRV